MPLAGPPGFQPLNTLLQIIPLSGANALWLTPYAARGASQTIKQIGGSDNLRRTVIGTMINLAPPWFHQYESTVTCKDVNAPCLDDAWRGMHVELHCCSELSYTGSTPHRPVVPGSTRTEGAITFYRPILICMVMDIDPRFEEYEGQWTWRVDFQELGLPA
jgi:hypothetical protein